MRPHPKLGCLASADILAVPVLLARNGPGKCIPHAAKPIEAGERNVTRMGVRVPTIRLSFGAYAVPIS
jgi:hypothetical protein